MENIFMRAFQWGYDECPETLKGMIYTSEVDGDNGGFFSDLNELFTFCLNNQLEIPPYVWCTNMNMIHIDATKIVEDACEKLYDGAFEYVDPAEINVLQNLLDMWCLNQNETLTYVPNYTNVIIISEDDLKEFRQSIVNERNREILRISEMNE